MHDRGFGGNIERRIVRAVGNQRQRHQNGDRNTDKADQFIETIILSWSQNAHECLLEIGGRCSSQEGCAGAGARIPSGSARATQRLYQRPAGRQERYREWVVGRLPRIGSRVRWRYRVGIMLPPIKDSEKFFNVPY